MATTEKKTESEKVLAAIAKIDETARLDKEKHLDGLKAIIAEKKAAMKAIELEVEDLYSTMAAITGKAYRAAGLSSSGEGSSTRMKKEDKEKFVEAMKAFSGQTLASSEIAEKCGFTPKQWTVVKKAFEDAGGKCDKIGDNNRNAKWKIKA
jgi:hypothetical protein